MLTLIVFLAILGCSLCSHLMRDDRWEQTNTVMAALISAGWATTLIVSILGGIALGLVLIWACSPIGALGEIKEYEQENAEIIEEVHQAVEKHMEETGDATRVAEEDALYIAGRTPALMQNPYVKGLMSRYSENCEKIAERSAAYKSARPARWLLYFGR